MSPVFSYSPGPFAAEASRAGACSGSSRLHMGSLCRLALRLPTWHFYDFFFKYPDLRVELIEGQKIEGVGWWAAD